MSTVKAIIFDCFGVLTRDSLDYFCSTYLSDRPEVASEIKRLDQLSVRGELSWDELIDEIVARTEMKRGEVVRALDMSSPNVPLLDYIANDLKPSYKIGLLSNVADNWLDDIFTPYQMQVFDDFTLSYEHGMIKPDQAIYQLAAERLAVSTDECMFVDDNKEYCRGAEKSGMRAIQYVSFEQLKSDLDRVLQG